MNCHITSLSIRSWKYGSCRPFLVASSNHDLASWMRAQGAFGKEVNMFMTLLRSSPHLTFLFFFKHSPPQSINFNLVGLSRYPQFATLASPITIFSRAAEHMMKSKRTITSASSFHDAFGAHLRSDEYFFMRTATVVAAGIAWLLSTGAT